MCKYSFLVRVDVTKLYESMASRFHVDPTFTGYGKSGVRLLKIKRSGKYHDIKQIEVATELKLANYQDYITGNNTSVIPTDTQKNTVYALAKDHPVGRSLYFLNFCHLWVKAETTSLAIDRWFADILPLGTCYATPGRNPSTQHIVNEERIRDRSQELGARSV